MNGRFVKSPESEKTPPPQAGPRRFFAWGRLDIDREEAREGARCIWRTEKSTAGG